MEMKYQSWLTSKSWRMVNPCRVSEVVRLFAPLTCIINTCEIVPLPHDCIPEPMCECTYLDLGEEGLKGGVISGRALVNTRETRERAWRFLVLLGTHLTPRHPSLALTLPWLVCLCNCWSQKEPSHIGDLDASTTAGITNRTAYITILKNSGLEEEMNGCGLGSIPIEEVLNTQERNVIINVCQIVRHWSNDRWNQPWI